MSKRLKVGAALMALAILPAAVFLFHLSITTAFSLAVCIGPMLFGTATVTYLSFLDGSGPHGGYAGGTTAPTQAQVQTVQAVVADVLFGDTDTTATITHNFQLTAAQLAAGWAEFFSSVTAFTTANAPVNPIVAGVMAANTLTLTKNSVTSSGGTVRVWVRRPYNVSA